MELPEKLQNVIDHFKKIPGIGEKTALRQVLFLTNWDAKSLSDFGRSLEEIGALKKCLDCGMFSEIDLCLICSNEHRAFGRDLCVVETIADCMAIERGKGFPGLFHILGGTLNPLMGIGPKELNIEKLVKRVTDKNIEHVVLALNPSVEGDATCAYIKSVLPAHISVERIGFGIPIGGNLEYLDSLTIAKAIENRRPI